MERDVNEEGDSETNDGNLVTNSIIKQRSTEFLSNIVHDTGKCNHFCIRAYVAEIRRKDWKICWPFDSYGENKELIDQAGTLPLLPLPEFRWWCCQNCLQSSDASDASEEKNCEGKEANFKTSVDMTSYEYMPLIDLLRKEKFVDLMSNVRNDVLASGIYENNIARNVNEGISEPTSGNMEDAQCLNEESVTKDTEAKNLDFGGSTLDEPGNIDCQILDVDELEFGNRNSICTCNCSTEMHQKGGLVHKFSKIGKTCEQGKDLSTRAQKPESSSVENEILDSRASYSRKFCENADNIHHQHHSNPCDSSSRNLKHRKPRKVRLLTDILRKENLGVCGDSSSSNEIVNSDNINSKITCTEAADEPDDFTLDTLFRSQKSVKVGNSTENKKKRKMLQVEGSGPCQMRRSNSGFQDSQCHDSNEAKSCIKSVIGSSASVSNAFARVSADVGFKSHSEKTMIDELVIQTKKKHTSSSIEGTDVESKETGTGTLQCSLAKDAPTETGFNHSLRRLGERECDRKSSLSREGSDKSSLMPPDKRAPTEEWVVGEVVEVGPYTLDSYSGRVAPCCLKRKKDTFRDQKDIPLPCNHGNNIDAQARLEVAKKQSSERANKVCELEASDDIPMEIVKLLAANRRKRRLLEVETTNRNAIFASRSAHGVKNSHTAQVQRKSMNVEEDICTTGKNVEAEPFGVKSIRYYSQCKHTCTSNISKKRMGESHDAKGSLAFSFSQDNRSSGNQFPEAGSGGNFSIQRCRWVEDSPNKIKSSRKFEMSPKKQSKKFDVKMSNKLNTEKPCACVQKKIGKRPKLAGSLHICGNESIPAMQLLQLMDAGMSSKTSLNTSDAYKLPFSADPGKNYTVENPLEHFPSIDRDTNCTQTSGSRGKFKGSCAHTKAADSRLDGFVSRNKNLCKNHQSYSVNGLKKGLSFASNSMAFPLEPDLVKNVIIHVEVNKKAGIVRPVKSSCRTEICSINRNPADFSIAVAGNKFMRRIGNFKRRIKNLKTG